MGNCGNSPAGGEEKKQITVAEKMNTNNTKQPGIAVVSMIQPSSSYGFKKPRFLCLHGWRTNGDILKGQMKAFNEGIAIQSVYMNAPLPAAGPPDELISVFYPNRPYFQWHYNSEERAIITATGDQESDITKSLKLIKDFVEFNGPFDGMLGFSQGAEMATRFLQMLYENEEIITFKGVILIGGVPPIVNNIYTEKIQIPSLHLIGTDDSHYDRCKDLLINYYDLSSAKEIQFNEGHNIPSVRTKIYKDINSWIESVFA